MKLFVFNKKRCFGIIAVLVLFPVTSCKKLLEIPGNPPDQISTDLVFTDSADILSAVTGIYSNFKVAGGGSNFLNGQITYFTGMSADELQTTGSNDFFNNQLTVDNSTTAGFWSSAYSSIYQINACLDGIGTTTVISDTLKNQLIGEIKVARALEYFNLVNLFGGVPIVISKDYKITQSLGRSSIDSVYAFILSDLTDAVSRLKVTYPSAGHMRPNLDVAQALLARVYLYRNNWQLAADLSNSVIHSGLYSLTDLLGVFWDGSTEAIWQLPTTGALSYQTAEGYALLPYSAYTIPTYQISPFLLNAFEAGDNRKNVWLKASVIGGVNYYYAYKYKNRTKAAIPQEDYMVLRLGEQYLINAEANAHLGNLEQASASLNIIRKRAGLSNSIAATQQQILDTIMHEREVELCTEWGHRWYDLKRTNSVDSILGIRKANWHSTASLYPIPQVEINKNLALTQNNGY